jgi:hypothetical protein
MSVPFKHIEGNFSGTYYTDQKSTLVGSSDMPEPNRHFVKLYIGELTEATVLDTFNLSEYVNRDALILENVTNIQVHPGDSAGVIKEKIVCDFGTVVIKNARVRNSWEMNGKTYGVVEGHFIGTVKEPSNHDKQIPPPPDPVPMPPEPNDGCLERAKGCLNTSSGCFSRLWDILKWLLLILALLLLLKYCNGKGGCTNNFYMNNCQECIKERDSLRRMVDSLKSKGITSCNQGSSYQGSFGINEKKYVLGNKSGRVTIDYNMKDIPDKIEVFYEGKLVTSTHQISGNKDGFVSHTGKVEFEYIFNKEDFCIVRLTGNDNKKTAWTYILRCPE